MPIVPESSVGKDFFSSPRLEKLPAQNPAQRQSALDRIDASCRTEVQDHQREVQQAQIMVTRFISENALPIQKQEQRPEEIALQMQRFIENNRAYFALPPQSTHMIVDPLSLQIFVGNSPKREDMDMWGNAKGVALQILAQRQCQIGVLTQEHISKLALHEKECLTIVTAKREEERIIQVAGIHKEEQYHDDFVHQFSQAVRTFVHSPDKSPENITSVDALLTLLESQFTVFPDTLAKQIYPLFVQLTTGTKGRLSPDDRKQLVQTLQKHSRIVYHALASEIRKDPEIAKAQDGEDIHRTLFGLTHAEVAEQRKENWKRVSHYLAGMKNRQNKQLTTDDLEQIHILSSKGILPDYMHGFRFGDYKEFIVYHQEIHENYISSKRGTKKTQPFTQAWKTLDTIKAKANELISQHPNSMVFEQRLAPLVAEYAALHPHPDGNGTMAIFFAEACKALSGNYPIPQQFESRLITRLRSTFPHNPLATLTVLASYSIKERGLDNL